MYDKACEIDRKSVTKRGIYKRNVMNMNMNMDGILILFWSGTFSMTSSTWLLNPITVVSRIMKTAYTVTSTFTQPEVTRAFTVNMSTYYYDLLLE